MSRSRKGKRVDNKEYWKARPASMGTPGKVAKDIAKSVERAQERELERRALADDDVAATDGPKRSPCKPRN